MKEIETIRNLFQKYDLSAPIEESVRLRILRSKKKILSDIFARKGIKGKDSISRLLTNSGFSFSIGGFMKKGLIATGVCGIIAVIGISVFLINRTPNSASSSQAAIENSKENAEVVFVIGDVTISSDSTTFKPLTQGTKVAQNDTIKTGEKASAVLKINSVGSVRVLEKSEFRFTSLAVSGSNELLISKGGVYSKISKLEKGTSYKVKTPTCVAAVRGTQFLVSYSKTTTADVQVLDGKVAVTSSEAPEKEVVVEKEQSVEVKGKNLDKRTISKVEKLVLEKCSLYDDIDKDDKNYDKKIEELQKKEKVLDEQINKLTATEKINPLDRLRNAGKPLTMLYLRDGSQLAGSVISANEKSLSFDTGDGVIQVPTAEILRRVMIK
jgi:hypothetical protein